MIQRVPLEQGKNDVCGAAYQSEEHHNENLLFYLRQEREDLSDAKVFQMFGYLFFHYAFTSWLPLWVS